MGEGCVHASGRRHTRYSSVNGVETWTLRIGREEFIFFFKQKTAYEIYQCDWSSDVCSSDLYVNAEHNGEVGVITLGRESYNYDVDEELNRAID